MTPSPKLAAAVQGFFEQLQTTVNAVLVGEHQLVLRQSNVRFTIEPKGSSGGSREIPWLGLFRRGVPEARVGRLHFRYELTLDHKGEHLKVFASFIEVVAETDKSARLRLDFAPIVAAGKSAPIAHWQLHAHHNAFAHWLTLASQRTANQRQGRLERVHLPVGGERYRPCLEDVLQLLKTDFAIATKPGAQGAIDDGRARWRDLQLRAAVRDNPQVAAEALEACGYQVGAPASASEPKRVKLRQY